MSLIATFMRFSRLYIQNISPIEKKFVILVRMLKRVCLYICLLVLCLFKANSAFSTHLVGGFISYQYIAETAQGVKYRITITSYRDCKPGSVQFADDIDVCIFMKENGRLLFCCFDCQGPG